MLQIKLRGRVFYSARNSRVPEVSSLTDGHTVIIIITTHYTREGEETFFPRVKLEPRGVFLLQLYGKLKRNFCSAHEMSQRQTYHPPNVPAGSHILFPQHQASTNCRSTDLPLKRYVMSMYLVYIILILKKPCRLNIIVL